MILLPAIDLYEGQVVRLYQGDFARKTVYDVSPAETARRFFGEGAEYLHLVDLEGAKTGTTANAESIESIVRGTSLRVEVGGGIRTDETVEKYLNMGVYRVILGTSAIVDRPFLRRCLEKYGAERIAVGVDIQDGCAAIRGWTERSQTKATDLISELSDEGVRTFICTDISKDGAMGGTNLTLYRELQGDFGEKPVDFVASGGVSSLQDVIALRDAGVYGAILGRALYNGAIDLREALEVCTC